MLTHNKKVLLAIQNDEEDPPHLAGMWLSELGIEIRTLKAFAGEAVPTTVPDDVDALMPLGGHMNALDDVTAPWLANERLLLADAVKKDIPIFAICLGAQLLAAANGGTISRQEQNEIGVYNIELLPAAKNDPVMNFESGSIAALWHEDFVSQLPEGATTIASSELCPNQIYKMGTATYAVQFHPEADAGLVALWEAHNDNAFQSFKESGKTTVAPEMNEAEAELIRTWKPILQNWGKILLSR